MSKALDRLFFLGRPLGPIYSGLMKLRESLYHKSFLRQHSLPVPVISISNLMLGGTGKTPTVLYIAKLLLQYGYKPAIISRGYGGKASDCVNIVSTYDNILLSPELAGDEPYLLASTLPKVPVLTGKKRIFPCRCAIEKFDANVLILDDGFQHISVKRDIDIVLFDSTVLAGNSRVFPGGPLREPVSALNRCQAFLMTGRNRANQQRVEQFEKLLKERFIDKPVFFSTVQESRLIESGKTMNDRSLMAKDLFAFCGIANPERFEKALESHGIKLKGIRHFKDHSPYSQERIDEICDRAVKIGANALVTTQKDEVKLQQVSCSLPLFVLKIENRPDKAFSDFLLNRLESIL